MQTIQQQDLLEVARRSEYPLDAFVFVQRGLDFTVRRMHGEMDTADEAETHPQFGSRHVNGQMLCEGLRDFALSEYGMLARTVLKRWRIRSCEDFGRIVYHMVDAGLMHKTDEDSYDDFKNVFDFNEAFDPQRHFSSQVG